MNTTRNTCPICIENFDDKEHKKIACPNDQCEKINGTVCMKCLQTYFMTIQNDPGCVFNCGTGWTYEYIQNQFPYHWFYGRYAKYRKNILLDREKSLLPEAQIKVEKEKEKGWS